ncbi:MAG: L-2-hydroxyglutarate dehydrogenase [Chlamydiae bacterium]|nr:L-2-hydroxyglutarate dehydrogenase [Chlamydiota bacterium]
MHCYDISIIGGGIVGLATAYTLLKTFPKLKIALVEKEREVAKHQTGHNSGVIHTGIYYKPGSLKAKNCVKGVEMLLAFCDEHAIPYDLCGKLIVATEQEELGRLHELYRRGVSNGVKGLKLVDKAELKKIEPYSNGIEAIHSPNTGIVDYKRVSEKLLEQIKGMGADVYFGFKVEQINESSSEIIISNKAFELSAKKLVNCAGLHSDTIARMSKCSFKEKIIPFRGEYYFLSKEASHMLKGLIYPVPNPKFPFLGVHLTKRITGQVELGPNAVLALAREGYKKSSFNVKEFGRSLKFRGFWAMSSQNWKTGLYELYRSYSKKAFLRDIQRLMPDIREMDLTPGGSGVRAQAVSPTGKIIDDFLIYNSSKVLNVLNAPSPGATSSLSIGEHLQKTLDLSKVKYGA